MNWPDLTCNNSTQLHDALIGHARLRQTWLAAAKLRLFVLNASIAVRLFTLEFAICISSVHVLWTRLTTNVQNHHHHHHQQQHHHHHHHQQQQQQEVIALVTRWSVSTAGALSVRVSIILNSPADWSLSALQFSGDNLLAICMFAHLTALNTLLPESTIPHAVQLIDISRHCSPSARQKVDDHTTTSEDDWRILRKQNWEMKINERV